MSLLPSRGPEVSTAQEGEMEVIGVDEDVEPLLDALASDTARAVLNAIYDDPGTPSEIADRLDMSIQKVSYHLEKLENRDLIAVAGTRYSEKGQEMTVYEPPDEPLVLFVGTQERKDSLKTLVKRLLPTVGVLAFASVAMQQLFGGGVLPMMSSQSGSSDGGPVSYDAAEQATETATEAPAATAADSGAGGNVSLQSAEATQTSTSTPMPTQASTETVDAGARATEAIAASPGLQVSPGIAFFLGGLLVLTLLVGWWGYRNYA